MSHKAPAFERFLHQTARAIIKSDWIGRLLKGLSMLIEVEFADEVGGKLGGFVKSGTQLPLPDVGEEVHLQHSAYRVLERRFNYEFNCDDENYDTHVRVQFRCAEGCDPIPAPKSSTSGWC